MPSSMKKRPFYPSRQTLLGVGIDVRVIDLGLRRALIDAASKMEQITKVGVWNIDQGGLHACDSSVADGSSAHRNSVALFNFLSDSVSTTDQS